MITMHVSYKDTADLANPQIAAEKLMLGTFPTVKQPDLSPLGQAEGNTRNIARSRWYTGACAQEGNLQG